MIKGILIDAANQTVSHVNVAEKDGAHLASMREHIQCDIVDVARELPALDGNDLWIDDEGSFAEPLICFGIIDSENLAATMFAGNGLVLSYDPETGDSKSATADIDKVRASIIWLGELRRKG